MSSPASTPSRRGSRRAAPAQPRECLVPAVPHGVPGEGGRCRVSPRAGPVPPAPTPRCPPPPQARTPCRPESRSRCPRRLAPSPAPRPARRPQVRCRGWDPGRGVDAPLGSFPLRPGSPVWMRSPAVPLDLDMSSPLTYGTPSSRVEGTPRSGVRGTPVRQRPDLGSARKGLQVDLHSDGVSPGPVGARWGARCGRSPEPTPVGFSCAAGRRRYSGERAVFGPKTRDLGNRCKRGDVQRKLSGEIPFLQASKM